jgi:prefoldin subunit 5
MYQLFLAPNIIENYTNLEKQTAKNISYLKNQMNLINNQVVDLSGNVQTIQSQVNQLVQSQQQYANQMTGGTPPQVTGLSMNGSSD